MTDIDPQELARLIAAYVKRMTGEKTELADTPLSTEPELHTRDDN